MGLLEAALLGLIQGLTEFLPVSSSGHLVIFQNLLGFKEPELLLDSVLHGATLLAVCIFFRRDIQDMATALLRRRFADPDARLAWAVLLGSIPTGLIGVVFREPLEALFGSLSMVAFMLLITGAVLAATHFLRPGYTRRLNVPWWVALLVGVAQGAAITPGISRSGTTIAVGLFWGLDRNLAGRYSFLLSIPAIVGALFLQVRSGGMGALDMGSLAVGFAVAFLVGLLALKVLMGLVRRGRLAYFAPYCWAVGLLVLLT